MNEQWQELKETIIELRDGDGTGTQQEVCKFLVNYMGILEKQMQESSGDVISRQAVLDIVDSYSESRSNVEDVTQDIISDIMALPPVTPQEPCEMTAEEYRQRMIQAFHNANTDELIALCVLPTEKEFEHLEWLLKNHYKQKTKIGYWIIKDCKEQGYDIGGVKTWYIQIKCSECGFIKTAIEGHTGQYHYCPHCGAKMVKPQESEG